MIKLIQFLLTGCWHKWRIVKETGCNYKGDFVGTSYDLQCDRCGNIKYINPM